MTRVRMVGLSFVLVVALAAPVMGQVHSDVVVAVDPEGRLRAVGVPEGPFRLPPSRLPGLDGYAGDGPSFRSLAPAEQTAELLPLDAGAQVALELVYTDRGLVVLSDDGSAPMRRGELFKLGAAPFDTHLVWILTEDMHRPSKVTVRLRDRAAIHDPSPVMSFTFVPDPAVAAYFCPERCEGPKTYDAPGRCPRCGTTLTLATTARYSAAISFKARPSAGAATSLAIALRDPTGAPVTDLESVDGRQLRVVVTSADLAWFAHGTPTRRPDGTFDVPVTFPAPGAYSVFLVFTPPRTGRQVVSSDVVVAGPVSARAPLDPDPTTVKTIDGITVTLRPDGPVAPLHPSTLTFSFTRDGTPVRDLEPVSGALGHLVVVAENRTHFVYARAREPGGSTGPDVTFGCVFPVAGVYKMWGQFRRAGKVLTVPFTVRIERPESPPRRKGSPAADESGEPESDAADDPDAE